MAGVQSVLAHGGRRRALALVLGLGLALAGTPVVAPAVAAETTLRTPVRIMPMGDSITHGVGASGGYRLELKDLLVPAGHSFDFVGSQASGPFEIEDRQHQGHSGFKIHDIAALARDRVTTYRPDVVLLVIGTNDVTGNYELDAAPDRLAALVDTIVEAAPASKLIVGSIPPLADATDDAQARDYNAAIPGLVQARAAAGKNVSFVDMYGAMTPADLVDGVHPDADGYLKMANVWLPALQAVLPEVPPTTTPSCPCSAWSTDDAPIVSQATSTSPTEVGVRFRVEQYGYITGVRFYKGPMNTGVHKGNLWTRDGRLLASATFTDETESGWQQVSFSSPVVVWPWTTYVASYFAPVGRYAADPSVFTQTEIVTSPVRLLAAGQSGGNGWSVGSATGGFPSSPSPQAANHWVDVVFVPSTEPAPPPPPPSAPGNLRVTAVTSSQVSLAWNDVIGETGFRVERSAGGTNDWTAVGLAARDNWAFVDTGLAGSTTYSYRVVATSRNGDSAPSEVVTTTTAAPPLPAVPTGVTAVAVSSSRIDVAWQDVAGESGYRVQRSVDGVSGWVQVGATGQNVVSFSDTGLAASTTYWYRVVAFNNSGTSAPSAVVSATTPAVADTQPPSTPTKLKATAAKSKVNLSWTGSTDSGSGVAGYRIYRSSTGLDGSFTPLTTTTSTSAGVNAPSGVALWYRVTAYDVAGNESMPSPTVRAVAR
jgi:lysophospholipase L1-like esterase/fibronectin type 3 domain-containing protein